MYGTIADILKDLDKSELIDLINDEGRPAAEIIIDEDDESFDETDVAVARAYGIINDVDALIDSFLRTRYAAYMPLSSTPVEIKSIAVDLYICDLKKRRKRENMPESLENIRKACINDLKDFQKGVRTLDVGQTETTGMAAEVAVNKTAADKIFNKTDTWDKY